MPADSYESYWARREADAARCALVDEPVPCACGRGPLADPPMWVGDDKVCAECADDDEGKGEIWRA